MWAPVLQAFADGLQKHAGTIAGGLVALVTALLAVAQRWLAARAVDRAAQRAYDERAGDDDDVAIEARAHALLELEPRHRRPSGRRAVKAVQRALAKRQALRVSKPPPPDPLLRPPADDMPGTLPQVVPTPVEQGPGTDQVPTIREQRPWRKATYEGLLEPSLDEDEGEG